MYLINTTFVTDRNNFDELVIWLKEVYIAEAMKSGRFHSHRVARVLADDDVESVSIACELGCRSVAEGYAWQQADGIELCNELQQLNGAELLYFTTILKQL